MDVLMRHAEVMWSNWTVIATLPIPLSIDFGAQL